MKEDIELMQAKEQKVVKHNAIIQDVAKRKSMLSALEQKILNYIISKIKPNQKVTDNEFVFDMRFFYRLCGGGERIHAQNFLNYREALENLASNGFWLRDGQKNIYFQWIVTPVFDFGDSSVIITISDKVMPYLCNLANNFTSYELEQILKLKSSYAVSMYEILKSYEYKTVVRLSVQQLRELLNAENKYRLYKDFNKNVLKPALNEINQKTNLKVEYKQIKNIRQRVTDIEFIISEKDGNILTNGNI